MRAIQNIDCVYLINLDQRLEKLKKSLEDLGTFSIEPLRVPAIYGWTLPRPEIERFALKFGLNMDPGHNTTCKPVAYLTEKRIQLPKTQGEPIFYPMATLGSFGCSLSHLETLSHAFQSGYQVVWILEDDFTIFQDPHVLGDLVERLSKLDPDWDILYSDDLDFFDTAFHSGVVWRPNCPSIDGQTFIRKPLGEQFMQISGRSQMRSAIYKRSGMQKILEFLSHGIFLPYPLELLFVPNLKVYNICANIVCGGPISIESSDVLFQYF